MLAACTFHLLLSNALEMRFNLSVIKLDTEKKKCPIGFPGVSLSSVRKEV